MLIINADDLGGSRTATDRSMLCFRNERITSASAMVFMADSERASELARQHMLDSGLHLNFTLAFSGRCKSSSLIERQGRIASFLLASKWCRLLYNPRLKSDFHYVYSAQYEEYVRLYDKHPTHVDGHHHMHLCTNVLIDGLIPKRAKVRRNFSFAAGEKNVLNRAYRRLVDSILTRRHTCTDAFFSISPAHGTRLRNAVKVARSYSVEIMTHPERDEDLAFLMSDTFLEIVYGAERGSYASL